MLGASFAKAYGPTNIEALQTAMALFICYAKRRCRMVPSYERVFADSATEAIRWLAWSHAPE